MMRFKVVFTACVGLLPAGAFKNWIIRTLGYEIGRGAHIGPCLLLNIDRIELGIGARIGTMTVIRDVRVLKLDDHSTIGQWNWISAARPLTKAGAPSELTVGKHSAITSRHYIDCSGGISIGRFSTIAGVRSTFITHGIRWKDSKQSFRGIEIGDYCLISSNVQVVPGATVDDRVVVGMGATIAGRVEGPGLHIQGRAVRVTSDLDGEYFHRAIGRVNSVHVFDVSHKSQATDE